MSKSLLHLRPQFLHLLRELISPLVLFCSESLWFYAQNDHKSPAINLSFKVAPVCEHDGDYCLVTCFCFSNPFPCINKAPPFVYADKLAESRTEEQDHSARRRLGVPCVLRAPPRLW